MRPLATFLFLIFLTTFHSFIPLVPPSSNSLLPTIPSFFLVQHCLIHLESVRLRVHFSSILMKALRADGPTDQRTDKASYRDADASK